MQDCNRLELRCKLIIIDPDKEDSNIFRDINRIFRHIKQATKKLLINKILTRLLENITKSKAMNFIINDISHNYM